MELLLPLLLFAVLIVPMMLMTRRQRAAQVELQKVQSALTVGDEVRTHSGFYGLIVEEFEDVVILETESGALTKWSRAALAGPAAPSAVSDAPLEPSDAERTAGTSEEFETLESADRADDTIPGVTARRDETDPLR